MKGKIFAMLAVFAMVVMAFGTINAEAKPDEKVKVVADASDQGVMMGINTINVETETVIITRLIDTGNDGTFDKMTYVIKHGNEVMSGTEDVEINTLMTMTVADITIEGRLGMFSFYYENHGCNNIWITIDGMGGYVYIQGVFWWGSVENLQQGQPFYNDVSITGHVGPYIIDYHRGQL